MKYRKRPVVVEAFQYDGDLMGSDGNYYVPSWAVDAHRDGTMHFKDAGELYIKTLEDDHHASVGDYIIKGVHGEFYSCKPDIFAETYESVEPEEASTDEGLKPCPFCGGSARIRDYKDVEFLIHNADCFMVQCDICGCGTSYEPTEERAIAAWNRRAVDKGDN